MKYSDETKSDFIVRVMRLNGFGRMEPVAAPRKPIPVRSRDEIGKEQEAHQERYFGKLYAFGSAEKWGYALSARPYSEVAE